MPTVNNTNVGFLEQLGWEIFIILLGIVIASIIGYFYREKIRIKIRSWKLQFFNHQFMYNFFFKSIYNGKTNDLSNEVFLEIKNRFPQFNITKISLCPDLLIIRPKTLGTKVLIQIDCYNELISDEEEQVITPSNYELTITLDDKIRLGAKNFDVFEYYMSLMNGIKEIIHRKCFQNNREIDSFVLCDVYRDINQITTRNDYIEGVEGAKISFTNNNFKITLNNHEFLNRLIFKYYGY